MYLTLLATSYSVFTAARASLALITVKGSELITQVARLWICWEHLFSAVT